MCANHDNTARPNMVKVQIKFASYPSINDFVLELDPTTTVSEVILLFFFASITWNSSNKFFSRVLNLREEIEFQTFTKIYFSYILPTLNSVGDRVLSWGGELKILNSIVYTKVGDIVLMVQVI